MKRTITMPIRLKPALLGAFFAALTSGIFYACSNDIQVNAPSKDVVIVFGTLNPRDSIQYIRVSRGYQVEGDAIQYGANNDLSLKNATVRLVREDNETYTLTPVDTIKQTGNFYPKHTVFATNAKIFPGRKYKLVINLPGDEATTVTAETLVPDAPLIFDVDSLKPDPPIGNVPSYTLANFSSERFTVRFLKSDVFESQKRKPGAAFEMRFFLKYGILQSVGDTLWQTNNTNQWVAMPYQKNYAQYGPLLIAPPNFSNTNCNFGDNAICFQVGRGFQNFVLNRLNDPNVSYVYRTGVANRSSLVEVRAIDQYLYNYMQVNNLSVVDFTTVKPEYSNLATNAPQKVGVAGVFGSVNQTHRYIRVNPCLEYLARLNNAPQPSGFCER